MNSPKSKIHLSEISDLSLNYYTLLKLIYEALKVNGTTDSEVNKIMRDLFSSTDYKTFQSNLSKYFIIC